jgi:hypothetical protein
MRAREETRCAVFGEERREALSRDARLLNAAEDQSGLAHGHNLLIEQHGLRWWTRQAAALR